MIKKTISKTEELFEDRCKICNQPITGYTKAQVNSRMDMHHRKHKKEDLRKNE